MSETPFGENYQQYDPIDEGIDSGRLNLFVHGSRFVGPMLIDSDIARRQRELVQLLQSTILVAHADRLLKDERIDSLAAIPEGVMLPDASGAVAALTRSWSYIEMTRSIWPSVWAMQELGMEHQPNAMRSIPAMEQGIVALRWLGSAIHQLVWCANVGLDYWVRLAQICRRYGLKTPGTYVDSKWVSGLRTEINGIRNELEHLEKNLPKSPRDERFTSADFELTELDLLPIPSDEGLILRGKEYRLTPRAFAKLEMYLDVMSVALIHECQEVLERADERALDILDHQARAMEPLIERMGQMMDDLGIPRHG